MNSLLRSRIQCTIVHTCLILLDKFVLYNLVFFKHMTVEEEAEQAIKELGGTLVKGQRINVEVGD